MLVQLGAPGLHFYTLNKEEVTYGIVNELRREQTISSGKRESSFLTTLAGAATLTAAAAVAFMIVSKRLSA